MAHVGLGGGSQMTGNSWTVLFSTHTAIVQLHGHHDSPGAYVSLGEMVQFAPGLGVELEVLSVVTVLYVELPGTVTALDVGVVPEVLVEPGGTIADVVMVVEVTLVKGIEVVPEVVVKDLVGVVPEVVTSDGVVDKEEGEVLIDGVDNGEDDPKVGVLKGMVGDDVEGKPVPVLVSSVLLDAVTVVIT